MMKTIVTLFALLVTTMTAAVADNSFSRLDADQFPLIMYAVPRNEKYFAQAKEMGINFVHVYGLSESPLNEARLKSIRAYLDLAQEHQLKVMFELDGNRRVRNKNRELALQETRQLAREFKDHPAMGFWYLYDEPELREGAGPDVLKIFYDLLKLEAPGIPVCVCTSTAREKRPGLDYMWNSFVDSYDLHIFDTYPIRGQEFPTANLTAVTKFNEKAVALGKPVIPALQAWNRITIDAFVQQAQKAGESTDNWRYPNLQELRFWNFATLIQGARGMAYWSFARAAIVAKSTPEWVPQTLKPAVLEFREFTDLVHPAASREVIETGNPDLFFAQWNKEGKKYFVLVNGKGDAQGIESVAVLNPLNEQALKPWKFTRPDAATINNGKINRVHLQPWEVLVWENL